MTDVYATYFPVSRSAETMSASFLMFSPHISRAISSALTYSLSTATTSILSCLCKSRKTRLPFLFISQPSSLCGLTLPKTKAGGFRLDFFVKISYQFFHHVREKISHYFIGLNV